RRADLAADSMLFALQRLLDLLVSLVLPQGVQGPQGSRQPADQRDLQEEADDARNRPAKREEGEPGQQKGDQQSHGCIEYGERKDRYSNPYMTLSPSGWKPCQVSGRRFCRNSPMSWIFTKPPSSASG